MDADAKAEIVRFTDRALQAAAGAGFGSVKTEVLRRFAEKLVGRACSHDGRGRDGRQECGKPLPAERLA